MLLSIKALFFNGRYETPIFDQRSRRIAVVGIDPENVQTITPEIVDGVTGSLEV